MALRRFKNIPSRNCDPEGVVEFLDQFTLRQKQDCTIKLDLLGRCMIDGSGGVQDFCPCHRTLVPEEDCQKDQ